jgi:hypothetical protein
MRRVIAAAALALPVVAFAAQPAGACGGLVGENGTIQLTRTTTLAAYTGGIERYVTAFEFSGEGESVGSIVPLPDIPTEVTRAGDWTLQRLVQEVAPPVERSAGFAEDSLAAASAPAEVILETQIDALDITVLKGGADEVGQWAVDNGFLLTPDAPEVLDFYAQRSPVFMVARFDAQRAGELGQTAGDSTPIMATIPTDDPWVPVRILGLGLPTDRTVEADVFLLTDEKPELLAGGPGLTLERGVPASDQLLSDLRSDVNMDWLPQQMWLTHMTLNSPASELDYDLAIAATTNGTPSVADTGVPQPQTVSVGSSSTSRHVAWWPVAAATAAGLAVVAVGWGMRRRDPAEPFDRGRWAA